ncbi:MAG TPA: CDC27 family protein, partial [Turneriella sp.]|nr:CDC27 family protein [Turneriella sp.]
MNTKIFFVFLLILVTTFSIHADENYNKALAAYEQKNFDTCLTVLKTVIRENETNYDAHILAAYCHVGRKTYSDAIYHLREVAENSLQHAQTVRTDIVNLYFAMGKYKTARNVGYKYLEAFEDENTKAPLD